MGQIMFIFGIELFHLLIHALRMGVGGLMLMPSQNMHHETLLIFWNNWSVLI